MNATIINHPSFKNLTETIISYDTEGNPYSYYTSDEWVLWSLNMTINFARLSGKFKLQAKFIYYNLITNSTLKITSGSIKNIMSGAIIFEKCITACGGNSYLFLNEDKNYRKVLIEAKSKNLKFRTWTNNLIFISNLYREGILLYDIAVAKDLATYLSGNDNGGVTQTLCIPERIANSYYSEALKFVENYHPYKKEISETYKIYIQEYESGFKKYKSHDTVRKNARKKTLQIMKNIDIQLDYSGHWLSRLRGACYIVIAAFTGCRDGEIRSLNLESYKEKKYANIIVPTINGVHTKPNIGGVSRETSWVTIPSVKKAIELLWISFEFAREHWREQAYKITHEDEKKVFLKKCESLFINLPHTGSLNPNTGRQALTDSLSSFIKYIPYLSSLEDVKEFNILNPSRYGDLKVGKRLLPHPHAFRRTFAVYLVKNKLASLLDIKYQFKHMNIAMTSWYANQANIASHFDMMLDTELQAEIAIENQNYVTDTLYYIYNEAETLAGPEGRRISNLRIEGSTAIYLNKEEIREQVKQGRLSIVEHPGGYCTNPNCDRICDMTTCQYKIVTKDQAFVLYKVREKLINKYTSLIYSDVDIPNIISKIYFEIKSIEKILSEHKIDCEIFSKENLKYD